MNEIMQGIAAALGEIGCDAEGTLMGRCLFRDDFAGFGGHFPERPILPAIVEILTVVALVGAHQGRRQRLLAVEDAKFLKPVLPGQELALRCRPRTVQGKELYDAELSVGDATTAILLLALAPAGEPA